MSSKSGKSQNPFEDILSSTSSKSAKHFSIMNENKEPSDENLSFKEEKTTVSEDNSKQVDETPRERSTSNRDSLKVKIPNTASLLLQSEVDDLVHKLKLLVGDFDTSDLHRKVQDKINISSNDNKTPYTPSNTSGNGVFSPSSQRKPAKNFPTAVQQNKPFQRANSTDRMSPVSNASSELDSRQSSARLTSNRYSVGFNIFSQSKNFALDFAKTFGSPRATAGRETILSIPITIHESAVDALGCSSDPADKPPGIKSPGEMFTERLSDDINVHDVSFMSSPGKGKHLSSTNDHSMDGFMEFSVISVDKDYMSGKKRLLRSNLQPSTMNQRFPHDQAAVVDNLHEYIFPYGCSMQTLRLHEWRKRKKTKQFEPKYQIMQFTDATHHIYHAYVIIIHERVNNVSNPYIIRQLEQIHTMTLASNTIKRSIKAYIYRKNNMTRELLHSVSFKWRENLASNERVRLDSIADSVKDDGTVSSKKAGKSTNSLRSFVKAIKHQFTGHRSHAASHSSITSTITSVTNTTEAIGGGEGVPGSHTSLTKRELTQNEQLLNAANKKQETAATSAWSKFLKGGKKKKKGTLSTKSSESSGSQYLTDDGFFHPMKGGMSKAAMLLNEPSPANVVGGPPHFHFDRQSLDGSPSNLKIGGGEDEDKRLSPAKRSNSVWAALETSTEERRRSSLSSPVPNHNNQHHHNNNNNAKALYQNPYEFYLRNNIITTPPIPQSSPGTLKRTESGHNSNSDSYSETSSSAKRTDGFRKPLKHIRSIRSFTAQLNKKVIIRHKALCFLTELAMPSIFFRILEALVTKNYKPSPRKQLPTSPTSMLKRVSSQPGQRLFSAPSYTTDVSTTEYTDPIPLENVSSESMVSDVNLLARSTSATSDVGTIERINTNDDDWFEAIALASSTPNPAAPPVQTVSRTTSPRHLFPTTSSPNLLMSESMKIHDINLSDYLHYLKSLNWADICKTLPTSPVEIAMPSTTNTPSTTALYNMIPPVLIPADPVTVEEWAVAILISLIPVDVIVHIHSLLLMEKSLLVLGSEASVVSILTTSFIHLLKPFKWAGVFVPILPPLAQEILDAPVPFIVGIVDHRYFTHESTHRPPLQISPTTSILYIDDFINYPNQYQPNPTDYQSLRSSITAADHHRFKPRQNSSDSPKPPLIPNRKNTQTIDDVTGEESFSMRFSISDTQHHANVLRSVMNDNESTRVSTKTTNASTVPLQRMPSFTDCPFVPVLRFFEPCKLEGDHQAHPHSNHMHTHPNSQYPKSGATSHAYTTTTATGTYYPSSHVTLGSGNSHNNPAMMSGIQNTKQLLQHTTELTKSLTYLTKRYLHLYMYFNHYHHYYDHTTYSMNYLIRKLLLDNHHITRHQRLYQIIKKILVLFYNYNSSYCTEILLYEYSWQNIATVNHTYNMLNIDLEKMLAPLKLTLAFQESICRTQMFASLIDQSYSTYVSHTPQREFLRDWLTYRFLIRKKRKQSEVNTSSTMGWISSTPMTSSVRNSKNLNINV